MTGLFPMSLVGLGKALLGVLVWALFLCPVLSQSPAAKAKTPVVMQGKEKPKAPGKPGPLKFLDGVLMTIDNVVILNSEVEDEFKALREARIQAGRGKPLSPREERQIYNSVRQSLKDEAIRSRATLSLPGMKSDQIRSFVRRVLSDQEQEQIKQYGSVSKMRDELEALGHSKFMLDRRRRTKILNDLKRQERQIRLRDRVSLMVTPKMLREHYRRVRKERGVSAVVDLGLVYYPKGDKGIDRAQEAVRAWRSTSLSSQEIASKFGGRALKDRRGLTLRAAKESGLRQFVIDFIGASKSGSVSPPLQQDNGVWILKIFRRDNGQDFRFNDPEVQEQLRRELLERELRRLEIRDLIRDRRKVHVWDPQRPRRK